MDITAGIQTRAHNETAHMLPTCSRIPILLQLHTSKQSLTHSIILTNLRIAIHRIAIWS